MIIDKKIGVEKKAFTLVEMSVVIVIIAVMLSAIIVSKALVTSAKINKIQQDYRDINILSTMFQNTFDCLPGDCQINNLTPTIINATPSSCFNLSTTTGMGNANSPGNTSGTTTTLSTLITIPNSASIASPADRTCAFYQMQAFEITGRTASIKQLFAINNANAIGRGKLSMSNGNKAINSYFSTYIDAVSNANINAGNLVYGWFYGGGGYSCGTSFSKAPWSVLSLNAGVVNCLKNTSSVREGDSLYDWLAGPSGPENFVSAYNGAVLNLNTAIQNTISLSIPTATNPQVPSFETQAMWDLRTVGSMASPGFYPFELNDAANFSSWKNKHILIARNSVNTNDLIDTSTTNTMAALPAFIAKKIDIKYDDGMPYTGNIISGQNISKMGSGTGCTTSTTISTATPTATSTTNYIASGTSDLTNGCVVAWKIDVV